MARGTRDSIGFASVIWKATPKSVSHDQMPGTSVRPRGRRGRGRSVRCALVAVAVSAALVLVYTSCFLSPPSEGVPARISGYISTETVDSAGDVGMDTSMAVDSNGKLHISYYDATNGDLKYATNVDGSWAKYTLDSAGDVGAFSSIAVDSSNKIHISYQDYTNFDLRYATNAGGIWVIYVLDSTSQVFGQTSIAVDSNDNVHICYTDVSGENEYEECVLMYATNARDGNWGVYHVIYMGPLAWDSSMTIDSRDNVHVSFYYSWGADLFYGMIEFRTFPIPGYYYTHVYPPEYTPGVQGQDNSVAVDSNGMVHISYYDESMGALGYTTNSWGGIWEEHTIDYNWYDAGMFTDIAVDSNDKVHISYFQESTYDLKYATNALGTWNVYAIDYAASVGMYTSIAIDSDNVADNVVHISYYDVSNSALKHAIFTGIPRHHYSLKLVPGWNLITLPIIDHGYKASTLGLSFGDVVVGWNSSRGTYEEGYIVGISPPSADFAILGSTGYWVYSGTAKNISLDGVIPTETQSMPITVPAGGGWAMIGLASLNTWNASDIPGMFNISDSIPMVVGYDPVNKTYHAYYTGIPFTDFALAPGEACWIWCGESGTLSYDP